jgi:hypothetical protein
VMNYRAAAGTPPFGRVACVSAASGGDPIKTKVACGSHR